MTNTLPLLDGPRDAGRPPALPPFARLRDAWLGYVRDPVLVYLAGHLALVAATLAIVAHSVPGHRALSPGAALTRWDGVPYLQIAHQGYETHLMFLPNGRPQTMRIAFFPLYPMLMRAGHAVTGLPDEYVGLAVSFAAALVAAVGMYRLFRPYLGHRTTLVAVALWGVLPYAFLESMVYTESLFTALAVWCMYALVNRRWLTAGGLAAVAGLVHSTAAYLAVTIGVAAALAVLRRQDGRRPWLGTALAPLGLVAYWVYLALRYSRPDAWFLAESTPQWSSTFDFGKQTLRIFAHLLSFSNVTQPSWVPFLLATACLVPIMVITIVLTWNRLLPLPLIVWAVFTVGSALLTSGTYASKPRFLLVCVPLVVPPAMLLSRARLRTRVLAIGTLALVGAWCGAYFVHISLYPW